MSNPDISRQLVSYINAAFQEAVCSFILTMKVVAS